MTEALKPVHDGDTVCIIGGGPGGAACAIALRREAARLGKNIRVVIFEQKRFEQERQYNQCIGVLSPPIETILREHLDIELPRSLIVREINGYCLHSDRRDLPLHGEENGRTYAVKRSRFDAFMLEQARAAGAIINHYRATGLEINGDGAVVYSDGENCHAAAVVGAFGLDEGSCQIFAESTPYRQPDFLNTIITRLYPGAEFLESLDSTIHAFLLSRMGLEFGAVTPKDDHLSINVAGREVTSKVMLDFLRSPPVQAFLPPQQRREKPLHYFKGKFPIAPARHLCGDRYVTIGDAAGLIRPFKGKGINSACLTGSFAARAILRHGVSKQAFAHYLADCRDITGDLPYGRLLRLLTKLCIHFQFFDHLLKIGGEDPAFMQCLFNSVSAHKSYKRIFYETARPSVALRMASEFIQHFILRQTFPERTLLP